MGIVQEIHKCKVFLSHKKEDTEFARALRDRIRARAGPRTAIMMSEDIPPGPDWYEEAKACMKDANWFVIVMRNDSASLDWCLYEAGIYRSLAGDDGQVACLHDPDIEPPEPFANCQSVPCTPEGLEAFVSQFASTS